VSVKIMAAVWELELPANEKLIALAFADHANDSGLCFPSLSRIAWKCGISRETAKRVAANLREAGILVVERKSGGAGRPPLYRINPEKGVKLTPFPKTEKGSGGEKEGSEPPQKGVTADTPEPNTGTETRNHQNPRAARTAAPGGATVALPVWVPIPLWAEFLNGRRIKPKSRAQELLVKELSRLRDQGHDPEKVIEQSIARGYAGFCALSGNENPPLSDNQKLGLTTQGHTVADRRARQFRTAEAVGFLDKGTFQKIRKELLDSGGNFEDDERVIAMCDSMNEKLFPTPTYCAVCAHTKSWHTRPLENRLRENPAYVDHEFVAGVVAR